MVLSVLKIFIMKSILVVNILNKLLISYGASLETYDNEGHTPLMIASYKGHLDVVKYLLPQMVTKKNIATSYLLNCLINKHESTTLWLACQGGSLPVVKFLYGSKHYLDCFCFRWKLKHFVCIIELYDFPWPVLMLTRVDE